MAPIKSKIAFLLAFLHPVYGFTPPRENSSVYDKSMFGNGPPFGVNSTKWPLLMADPDIEKIYPIRGYNISMPFPGEEIDGWTVSVSVQKSIPAKGNIETENPDGVFAASMYRLNPPEALVKEQIEENGTYVAHSSWLVGIGFERIQGDQLLKLNGNNGSCSSLLDDDGEYEGPRDAAGGSMSTFEVSSYATEIGEDAAAGIDWYYETEFMSAVSNVTDAPNATSVELVGNFLHLVMIDWVGAEQVEEGNNTWMGSGVTICPRSVDYTNASYVSGAAGGKPAALSSLVGLLPLALVFYLLG